jgi:hypothetical protein
MVPRLLGIGRVVSSAPGTSGVHPVPDMLLNSIS